MFAPADDSPRARPAWLDELNDQQRRAVDHDHGPLLVIAGAGSGKTRTLASRVARLIDDGVAPDRILLLTFTRRAAAEMLRRAGAMVANRSTARVWGGTFHAIGHRLLRRHGSAVGLADGFTVIDQTDSESLFGVLRADLGYATSKERFPRRETVAAIYSRTVNTQAPLSDMLERHFPWCRDHFEPLAEIFRAYTERKHEHNVVDYDDLLLYWRALLDSTAGTVVAGLFDHVLVDEYQDTNRIQADILSSLSGPNGNLTVVGDDAQAIYAFRAATVDNILGFPDDYPAATVVRLEQNYRSTPQILEVANRVIAESSELFTKTLWSARPAGPKPTLVTAFDESAQAAYVADQVLELRERGTLLRDQAVLFRTGHHSAGLEVELARRDIPYVKFGGLKFLEAAHVKDLLAALRIMENPRDELAWHRLLLSVPGIGPATSSRLLEAIDSEAARRRTDPLVEFIRLSVDLPREARSPVTELTAALDDCTRSEALGAAAQIDRLLPFFEMVFAVNYDDAGARLADLEALAGLAANAASRSQFLTDLALDPPNSTSDLAQPPHLDDDYLVLSTIHSAKGGEWDAVFVIHAADGNIPSDMALKEDGGLEEERRLLYVALTRARNELHITVPQRFYHRRHGLDDAHSYGLPSRFLAAATASCDERAVGMEQAPEATERHEADPVDGLLESLWQ